MATADEGAPVAAPPRAGVDEVHAHLAWALAIVCGMFAFLIVVRWLPTVGWPILLATIAAYLTDPIVEWLSRRWLSRTVATALLVTVGVGLSLIVVANGAPLALDQIYKLPTYMLNATSAMMDRIESIAPTILGGTQWPRDVAQLRLFLQNHSRDIAAELLPGAGTVLGTIVGGSIQAFSFILGALVVPIVTFFLLRGWPNLIRYVDELVPARQRPFVRARTQEIDRVLGGFVRGQLTMAAVLSTLYSIALSAIGLKLGVVVGVVTGFGNLVPYVGTATGLALSLGFCLVDFGADRHLAFVVITYAVLVATDGLFITPRVVGPRVGLSPAAVIVAVLTFGSLFGFAGVLLAVPSTAVLKIVARTLMDTWRRSRMYQEG